MKRVEAHILACNEAEIFLYAARHYSTFCEKIVLHDFGSTDGTLDIAVQFGIEIRSWKDEAGFDDRLNVRIKDTAWHGTKADWVCCVDCDEILWFPHGVEQTLTAYEQQGLPIAKPHGWEMWSDTMPTTAGQIYDEIKGGARDDKWYSKNVTFNPRLIEKISFAPGAHQVSATLKDGSHFPNPTKHSEPVFHLLHYHQVGSFEKIAKRYDERAKNLSETNIRMNWGNRKPGAIHTREKWDYILPRLELVVK